jgi:hypothetical protein
MCILLLIFLVTFLCAEDLCCSKRSGGRTLTNIVDEGTWRGLTFHSVQVEGVYGLGFLPSLFR